MMGVAFIAIFKSIKIDKLHEDTKLKKISFLKWFPTLSVNVGVHKNVCVCVCVYDYKGCIQ